MKKTQDFQRVHRASTKKNYSQKHHTETVFFFISKQFCKSKFFTFKSYSSKRCLFTNNLLCVQSTTRELSYIILSGIIACYAVTFAILARPSSVTWYIFWIWKTVRRCFEVSYFTKKKGVGKMVRRMNCANNLLQPTASIIPLFFHVLCVLYITCIKQHYPTTSWGETRTHMIFTYEKV